MSARRLLPLILLNIFVSAVVVLGILYWWDNRDSAKSEAAPVAGVVPTARATLAPQPTRPSAQEEAVEPAAEMPTYTVQAGDTLGSIAANFDVTLQDLMTANGIDDANLIGAGEVLIIPVGGLPTAAPPPTAAPTATPQTLEPPQPLESQLPTDGQAIVEIAGVVGVGLVDEEAILIKNSGNTPIALLGWRLTDEDGRAYPFGQVTLFGEGAAITVHSGQGLDGPADLYWGFDEAILRPGETVTLVDGEGNVRDTFVAGS